MAHSSAEPLSTHPDKSVVTSRSPMPSMLISQPESRSSPIVAMSSGIGTSSQRDCRLSRVLATPSFAPSIPSNAFSKRGPHSLRSCIHAAAQRGVHWVGAPPETFGSQGWLAPTAADGAQHTLSSTASFWRNVCAGHWPSRNSVLNHDACVHGRSPKNRTHVATISPGLTILRGRGAVPEVPLPAHRPPLPPTAPATCPLPHLPQPLPPVAALPAESSLPRCPPFRRWYALALPMVDGPGRDAMSRVDDQSTEFTSGTPRAGQSVESGRSTDGRRRW